MSQPRPHEPRRRCDQHADRREEHERPDSARIHPDSVKTISRASAAAGARGGGGEGQFSLIQRRPQPGGACVSVRGARRQRRARRIKRISSKLWMICCIEARRDAASLHAARRKRSRRRARLRGAQAPGCSENRNLCAPCPRDVSPAPKKFVNLHDPIGLCRVERSDWAVSEVRRGPIHGEGEAGRRRPADEWGLSRLEQ